MTVDNERNVDETATILHGITLEMVLTRLVAHYGWEEMGRSIDIRCFNHDQASNQPDISEKNPVGKKKSGGFVCEVGRSLWE